jgi:acetyl esterase/lipase
VKPHLLAAPLLLATVAHAANPILLWPKGAPGETGTIGAELDTTKPDGRMVAGKRVIRLGNVSQPTITVYAPEQNRNTGAAVLVCPGGAYGILAYDLEGTEVCEWLNSIGVTGVLLKYRVPKRTGDEKHLLPLADAQRAMRLIRSHAVEWKINPQRIGVLGFSAGGHLTANLSNNYDQKTYEPVDDADKLSARPDFALPIYPAYLVEKKQLDKLAPDMKVTTDTPPTFLVQTEDDGIHVENVLFYYLTLKQAKVPAELHVYPKGGHGYGLRPSEQTVTTWPKRAEEWMRGLGLLSR